MGVVGTETTSLVAVSVLMFKLLPLLEEEAPPRAMIDWTAAWFTVFDKPNDGRAKASDGLIAANSAADMTVVANANFMVVPLLDEDEEDSELLWLDFLIVPSKMKVI